MNIKSIKVNLFNILKSISDAQDLFSPIICTHHQQVAYLSYQLAKIMNLSVEEQREAFLAGLIHDIGALSYSERLELVEEQPMHVNNHAFIGMKLLSSCKSLNNIASIIKFHHMPWDNGMGLYYKGEDVPEISHIIHLADRVCVMIDRSKNVLNQVNDIMNAIKFNSNKMYNPKFVSALEELSCKEYVWLDLVENYPVEKVDIDELDMPMLDIDELVEITLLFSRVIDFRSKFTARHSAGVANVAMLLAQFIGFSEVECKMILVAGYLHDLGKLVVSNDILEKDGKLTIAEFNEIKSHTYYTYDLLKCIPNFEEIAKWAAYHHEKLDGTGYPFHIDGEGLSVGCRIIAVADIFTAIMEDRPYRKGMSDEQGIKVLNAMVKNNSLDSVIVNILIDKFDVIKSNLIKSQIKASTEYRAYTEELNSNKGM